MTQTQLPPPSNTQAPQPATAKTQAIVDNGEVKVRRGYKLTTALFFALIIIIAVAGKLVGTFTLTSMWAVVAFTMTVFVMALGADLQRTVLGVFISERNLMSLSRFQLAAWTILVCSAFVSVGVARVFAKVQDPLALSMPPEVWQLLGISATSAVGASMILKNKAGKEPADPAGLAEKVKEQTGDDSPSAVNDNRKGIAYANPTPGDARITDMFEGDELANTAYIDISKVQMFFFTLIALLAYAVNIYQVMSVKTLATFSFPPLSPGLVALLGISHAAYLGNKSVDQTRTA